MLELKNITYVVKNGDTKNVILDDVSFTVPDKAIVVITGQNGSGKSTLAKIIMGIIKPTSGKIIWNKKDITKLSITERAKIGVAYAFQQPVTFKGITVKKMLDLASGKELTMSEACNMLSKVGLCARDYIEREVSSKLSGGELKRVELAMTIARNAQLNVCDEPEAGIDLWSFDALVNLFNERKGSYLIISHQNRILEIADKLVLLGGGKLTKEGTAKEVMPLIAKEKCARLEV